MPPAAAKSYLPSEVMGSCSDIVDYEDRMNEYLPVYI